MAYEMPPGGGIHRISSARWDTQTFIAGERHARIAATGTINGAMDKNMFDLYVEGILAPALRPGDVVILDTLPVHRSTATADSLREIGARVLFLPDYSPDPNPTEMACSKLKALVRKVAARTCVDLRRAAGNACGLFIPGQCCNFFKAAGYETN